MGLQVTDEAALMLARSLEMAGIDKQRGGVRLRAARGLGGGTDIQVELAEGPSTDESIIERDGVRIFVDPSVAEAFPDAVVALDPQHDTIVIRPVGGAH